MQLQPSVAATQRRTAVMIGTAVIGLGASIASLIDSLGTSPAFCAESGCATVRESAWAHPLGVPMPVLGVAFFAAAVALGAIDAPRMRRALAIAGAAWAVLLIGVQALAIGAWCKLCLVADLAAVGYAITALAGAAPMRFSAARLLALGPALAVAIAGLALWTHTAPPAPAPPASNLPAFVQAAQAQAPGAATLVEVVDFECPFCRRLQRDLAAAIERVSVPVRVVRKMLPLEHLHPHAMAAALAYCCADAQGKGEAMAEVLYAAPPEELTPEGCEKLAGAVGCDLDRYRRDLPAAQARVAAEMAEVRAAGVHSLPTLFIADRRIEGAGTPTDELVALIEGAGHR